MFKYIIRYDINFIYINTLNDIVYCYYSFLAWDVGVAFFLFFNLFA